MEIVKKPRKLSLLLRLFPMKAMNLTERNENYELISFSRETPTPVIGSVVVFTVHFSPQRKR